MKQIGLKVHHPQKWIFSRILKSYWPDSSRSLYDKKKYASGIGKPADFAGEYSKHKMSAPTCAAMDTVHPNVQDEAYEGSLTYYTQWPVFSADGAFVHQHVLYKWVSP